MRLFQTPSLPCQCCVPNPQNYGWRHLSHMIPLPPITLVPIFAPLGPPHITSHIESLASNTGRNMQVFPTMQVIALQWTLYQICVLCFKTRPIYTSGQMARIKESMRDSCSAKEARLEVITIELSHFVLNEWRRMWFIYFFEVKLTCPSNW